MPDSEADIWIGWGTHVFREGDGRSKGTALEVYLNSLIDRAEAAPGDDFFSGLTRATFRGRPLTREEMLGYGSIMFAGGRDTVINSISGIIGHLSRSPSDFEYLRQDPKRIVNASEEYFRAISPVTHIGRVCPAKTEIHGVDVESGALVSLCFSSANHDETVFQAPEEVRLDRKPNPHVAFGFGPQQSGSSPPTPSFPPSPPGHPSGSRQNQNLRARRYLGNGQGPYTRERSCSRYAVSWAARSSRFGRLLRFLPS